MIDVPGLTGGSFIIDVPSLYTIHSVLLSTRLLLPGRPHGRVSAAGLLLWSSRPSPLGTEPGFHQTLSGLGGPSRPQGFCVWEPLLSHNAVVIIMVFILGTWGTEQGTVHSCSLFHFSGLQEAQRGHVAGRWGTRCEPRPLASPLQSLPLLWALHRPFPYEAFLLLPELQYRPS